MQPRVTFLQIVFRLLLVAAFCGGMIGLSIGASRLRDRYIHEPVCTPICSAKGMRFEGVGQHRKSDSAASCRCVGPSGDRISVPTRFFSKYAIVDFVARESTSTLGVVMVSALVIFGVIGGVATLRRRSGPPGAT